MRLAQHDAIPERWEIVADTALAPDLGADLDADDGEPRELAWADFAPYAPAVDEAGAVAFQARLRDGRTGVFRVDRAGGLVPIAVSGRDFDEVTSHPAGLGDTCAFYARRAGHGVLCATRAGLTSVLAGPASSAPREPSSDANDRVPLAEVGPLGPTIGRAGLAFRATLADGSAGIFAWSAGRVVRIAEARETFASFQGLPLIDAAGRVVFRADLGLGRQGLYEGTLPAHPGGSEIKTLVETGGAFCELGRFPSLADDGRVLFVAGLTQGGMGVFEARQRLVTQRLETDRDFESFRGVLPAPDGGFVVYATPRGGALGVYHGPALRRLVGLGDTRFGAPVVDLALNPVSINADGVLAVRLRLADERQLVARLHLGPASPR